jgi:ribosome-binding ATPase YchF (GTP1/OBG family)
MGVITQAKEKGLMHVEGKNYALKDGDIAYFRFHV